MECRIGETIPFDFVHIIIESMLLTLRSVAVQHKYLCWLSQSDVNHRKLRITTDYIQFYVHGKCTLYFVSSVKVGNKMLKNVERYLGGKCFS